MTFTTRKARKLRPVRSLILCAWVVLLLWLSRPPAVVFDFSFFAVVSLCVVYCVSFALFLQALSVESPVLLLSGHDSWRFFSPPWTHLPSFSRVCDAVFVRVACTVTMTMVRLWILFFAGDPCGSDGGSFCVFRVFFCVWCIFFFFYPRCDGFYRVHVLCMSKGLFLQSPPSHVGSVVLAGHQLTGLAWCKT